MEESVTYINQLLTDASAPFECELSQFKGRVLKVKRDFKPLEVMFEGPILHKIAEDKSNPIFTRLMKLFEGCTDGSLDYGPMWFWCGLNSLSSPISSYLLPIRDETAKQLKLLYHPPVVSPSATIIRVCDAIAPYLWRPLSHDEMLELESLTVVWTLNCFEHADDPVTYASYFLPSFMSHSCAPNATWTTIGETFVIRAQRHLEPGEELTVSYLTEEFALRPKDRRINHLKSTKFFTCDCPRCTSSIDDTRGFTISPTCIVYYPNWNVCTACIPPHPSNLSQEEIFDLLAAEKRAVDLVNYYDGNDEDEVIPTKTDPELFQSDVEAIQLESVVVKLGPAHWTYSRGYFQLSRYYKSIARYPKAISCLQRHLESRANYVRSCEKSVSSSYAWALEELGDLLLLHVSGAVMAGLSESRREDHCLRWNPRGEEDYETLSHSGIVEAYTESSEILTGVFGEQHEHARTAVEKLIRVKKILDKFSSSS